MKVVQGLTEDENAVDDLRDISMIGQFGVDLYTTYLVSAKVRVVTKPTMTSSTLGRLPPVAHS